MCVLNSVEGCPAGVGLSGWSQHSGLAGEPAMLPWPSSSINESFIKRSMVQIR